MPLRTPRLLALILVFTGAFDQPAYAQLTIYSSPKMLARSIRENPDMTLYELKELIPTLQYELRYASTDNFVGRAMYPPKTKLTFLRQDPARALQKVQEELAAHGLGLKIWDAYRPYSITVAFWNLIGDERYVANPTKGSGHNRGIAVDLTLIRLDSKSELPMGTGFDHFSDTAHHSFTQLPEEILQNRQLLKNTMIKQGFLPLAEEWWHYSWPEPKRFEILDIPAQKIKRIR